MELFLHKRQTTDLFIKKKNKILNLLGSVILYEVGVIEKFGLTTHSIRDVMLYPKVVSQPWCTFVTINLVYELEDIKQEPPTRENLSTYSDWLELTDFIIKVMSAPLENTQWRIVHELLQDTIKASHNTWKV